MFDQMAVRKRLAVAFGVLVILFFVVAGVAFTKLTEIDSEAVSILSGDIPKAALSSDLHEAYFQMRIKTRNNLIYTEDAKMKKEFDEYKEWQGKFRTALDGIEKIVQKQGSTSEAEAAVLKEIRPAFDAAMPSQDIVMDLALKNDVDGAILKLTTQARPAMKALQVSMEKYEEYTQKRIVERATDVVAKSELTRTVVVGVAIAAAILAIVIGKMVSTSITTPLAETVKVMEAVASGDLSMRIRADAGQNHELARMKQATQKMVESLNDIFGGMRADSTRMAAAAHELSSACSQVRSGSDAQSDATSAMAAALEEMSVSINHVSEISSNAQAMSKSSGEQANTGNQNITHMVQEIGRIAESIRAGSETAASLGQQSERISSITGVIKDVADQTNLLALNAAIEAARAGEQGRGFAVVADEVRKLAEKTTASAQEITEMVNAIQHGANSMSTQMASSVSRVDDGMRLATTAGESITAINDSSVGVVNLINDVTAGLNEQATVSQDIAQRVEKIVQMIEENAAAMRSVASTSEDLSAMAGTMQNNISKYRLAS